MPAPGREHLQVKQSAMPFIEAHEDNESQRAAWMGARIEPVVRGKKFIRGDLRLGLRRGRKGGRGWSSDSKLKLRLLLQGALMSLLPEQMYHTEA